MKNIHFIKAFIIFSVLSVLIAGYGVGQLQAAFLVFVLSVEDTASNTAANVVGFLISMVVCFFIFKWVVSRFILRQV
jgi:hypothetical protein